MSHDALAGSGVAATGLASMTVWLADIEIYLRVGVAVIGIVVGIFTGLYYFEAWLKIRRDRA